MTQIFASLKRMYGARLISFLNDYHAKLKREDFKFIKQVLAEDCPWKTYKAYKLHYKACIKPIKKEYAKRHMEIHMIDLMIDFTDVLDEMTFLFDCHHSQC